MLRISGFYQGVRHHGERSADLRSIPLLVGLMAAVVCACLSDAAVAQSRRTARRTVPAPQVVSPHQAVENASAAALSPDVGQQETTANSQPSRSAADDQYLLPAVNANGLAPFPSSRRAAQLPKPHASVVQESEFQPLPSLLACPHLKIPSAAVVAVPETPVQATASAMPDIVSPDNVLAEFAPLPPVVTPESSAIIPESSVGTPNTAMAADEQLPRIVPREAALAEVLAAEPAGATAESAAETLAANGSELGVPAQAAAERSNAVANPSEPTVTPESTSLAASAMAGLFRHPQQFQVEAPAALLASPAAAAESPQLPVESSSPPIVSPELAVADSASAAFPVPAEPVVSASDAAPPVAAAPQVFADLNRFRVQRPIPTETVAMDLPGPAANRAVQTEWLARPQEPAAPLTVRQVPATETPAQQETERENELLNRMRQPLPQLPLHRLAIPVSEEQKLVEPERFTDRHYESYAQAATIQAGPRELSYVHWRPQAFAWAAPNFYHRPLYFEEPNVERYGYDYGCAQPAVSAGHFFVSTLLLPMQIGGDHPCSRAYSLGYYRPGSCNPAYISSYPVTPRGLIYQTLSTVGTVFIFP